MVNVRHTWKVQIKVKRPLNRNIFVLAMLFFRFAQKQKYSFQIFVVKITD